MKRICVDAAQVVPWVAEQLGIAPEGWQHPQGIGLLDGEALIAGWCMSASALATVMCISPPCLAAAGCGGISWPRCSATHLCNWACSVLPAWCQRRIRLHYDSIYTWVLWWKVFAGRRCRVTMWCFFGCCVGSAGLSSRNDDEISLGLNLVKPSCIFGNDSIFIWRRNSCIKSRRGASNKSDIWLLNSLESYFCVKCRSCIEKSCLVSFSHSEHKSSFPKYMQASASSFC